MSGLNKKLRELMSLTWKEISEMCSLGLVQEIDSMQSPGIQAPADCIPDMGLFSTVQDSGIALLANGMRGGGQRQKRS